MSVVEFVWWSGTDVFLANLDELFKPTIDHVSNSNGCQRVFFGIQEEDKTVFWMIVVWESHQHHQAMMDRADYPQMVGQLMPYLNGELQMNHVEFNGDTEAAFSSNITEILFLSLKEGCNKTEIESALEVWTGKLQLPVTWGPTREDPTKWIVIIGCKDKKTSDDLAVNHVDNAIVQVGPRNLDLHQSLVDMQMLHLKLRGT